MKIEIKENDFKSNVIYEDLILFINDEEVFKGNKKEIIEKLNKIIEAWI